MMFVTNHAAMKIKDTLVISDLHIGLEHEILQRGIKVRQLEDLIQRTSKLIRTTKAKKLLLLGDVKHNVPFLKRIEEISVPAYLQEMQKLAEVTIVPGNHDGSIERICPKGIRIEKSSGIMIGKYGILHGHAKMSEKLEKAETIIIGHNHPLVMITDRGGAKFFRQVWIKGKMPDSRGVIIMPAFSRLVGGVVLNNMSSGKELLGPIARRIDLKKAEVFLLDGTCLGKLGDIKSK